MVTECLEKRAMSAAGAECRSVCTEAGMYAIRARRKSISDPGAAAFHMVKASAPERRPLGNTNASRAGQLKMCSQAPAPSSDASFRINVPCTQRCHTAASRGERPHRCHQQGSLPRRAIETTLSVILVFRAHFCYRQKCEPAEVIKGYSKFSATPKYMVYN